MLHIYKTLIIFWFCASNFYEQNLNLFGCSIFYFSYRKPQRLQQLKLHLCCRQHKVKAFSLPLLLGLWLLPIKSHSNNNVSLWSAERLYIYFNSDLNLFYCISPLFFFYKKNYHQWTVIYYLPLSILYEVFSLYCFQSVSCILSFSISELRLYIILDIT